MGENLCHGKDVFERMNYLYQASKMISKTDTVAAALYGNTMVNCAKKSVLRIEPDIKRSICKSCQCPLVPGETARVRLVSKPIKSVKYTCLLCKTSRRLPTKKGYKLWTDDPKSIVKVFNYCTPKNEEFKPKNLKLEKNIQSDEIYNKNDS